jgi:hypothetical protein
LRVLIVEDDRKLGPVLDRVRGLDRMRGPTDRFRAEPLWTHPSGYAMAKPP